MDRNWVIKPIHVLQLFHDSASQFVIGWSNACPQLREFALRIQVTVFLVVDDDSAIAVQRLIPEPPDLDGFPSKTRRDRPLAAVTQARVSRMSKRFQSIGRISSHRIPTVFPVWPLRFRASRSVPACSDAASWSYRFGRTAAALTRAIRSLARNAAVFLAGTRVKTAD